MIKLMHKKVLGKKGFTILELLVVVAIIAILAVVAVPQFLGAIDKARVSGQLADTSAVAKAATMYQFDKSEWPEAATVNINLTTREGDEGPYIDKIPTNNKWGGDFNYLAGTDATDEKLVISASLTGDLALDADKTYFTRTGDGTTTPFSYSAVATPAVGDIGTYYEVAFATVLLELTEVPTEQAAKMDVAADSVGGATVGTVRYVLDMAGEVGEEEPTGTATVYYIIR